MNVSDDLTALVFELRRAGSPAEKARALARAWRTVRGLNPTDRRLLAREAGFDGVEDLIEGLARKGGGAFAPAAVLAALGKMRDDKGLSVRGAIADLRDPDRRDDLLARGLDLAARSFDRVDEVDEVDEALVMDEPAVDDGAPAPPIAEAMPRAPHPRAIAVSEIPAAPPGRPADRKRPMVPPPRASKEVPPTDEEPDPEPTAPPEEREPSVWEAGFTRKPE